MLTLEDRFTDAKVHTHTSPPEALKKIEEGLRPDIVILDLNMPGTNGLVFAQSLLKLSPNLKIILYSGIIDDLDLVHNIQIGFMGMLEKPASEEVIYQEIVRVLQIERHTESEYINYDMTHARGQVTWSFDIYVILGENRYIKLFNKGDKVDHQKVGKMTGFEKVQYAIKLADFLSIPTQIYTSISISQLPLDEEVPCDLLLKKEGGFKKILAKSSLVTKKTLDVFASHKIKSVYVDRQFESYFLDRIEKMLSGKINDLELEREEKVKLVLALANRKIQELVEAPSPETVSNIWEFSSIIVRFMEDDKSSILDIINLNGDDSIKSHVINVATLSVNVLLNLEVLKSRHHPDKKVEALSKGLNYSSDMKRNLTFAALLHELGYTLLKKKKPSYQKSDLPQDIANEINETCSFLSQISFIPEKVIQLIKQSEEKFDGSGPKKLFKVDIDIYAQILAVANQYDKLISASKDRQTALLEMLSEKNKFNSSIVLVLKEVILDKAA